MRPKISKLVREPRVLLVAIVLVSGTATVGAMRRTSTTFDEIVMIAGGARGFELGRFDLVPEHPPLTQFIYGLPVYLAGPNYPPEPDGSLPEDLGYRYLYAREFFGASGNDPERVAFLGRLAAPLLATALVILVYAYTRRAAGPGAALLAAFLIAFLPDMLAHGGVAYNDVPVTVAFLASLWAIDRAARGPSPWRALVAGALAALAIGIKFSALALYPAGVLVLAWEAIARRRDRAWVGRLLPAAVVALVAHYLALVLIYQGDLTLAQLRHGLGFTAAHVSRGHGAPAFLLGETSPTGWWYFFPVAFLLKTPAALHVLTAVGVVGLLRAAGSTAGPRVDLLASPLRVPVLGGLAFGAALLGAKLHIGFRYALPLMPLLLILVAVGLARLWPDLGRRMRAAVALLLVWYAASALSYYPHFLAYTSEYGPGRGRGHEALVDSSLDWGQGLLELRNYMHENRIDRIYLSYFGSALPEGYGIDYVPLQSFLPLLPLKQAAETAPTHIVVSATNLAGVYLQDDPFAQLRNVQPDVVLGHTLFVYSLDD